MSLIKLYNNLVTAYLLVDCLSLEQVSKNLEILAQYSDRFKVDAIIKKDGMILRYYDYNLIISGYHFLSKNSHSMRMDINDYGVTWGIVNIRGDNIWKVVVHEGAAY